MSKFILFLFLLCLINCNDEQFKNNATNGTKTLIDSKKSFNLTVDTIDTMMVCSYIIEENNYVGNVEKNLLVYF